LAALIFAQRFRCAAAILPLASTDILRRLRVGPLFPAYTPVKAEIAAFKPESCFSTRSRSFFLQPHHIAGQICHSVSFQEFQIIAGLDWVCFLTTARLAPNNSLSCTVSEMPGAQQPDSFLKLLFNRARSLAIASRW
jgi:hypothetical protein